MMARKWIIILRIFVLINFGSSLGSMACRKSDCRDEYASEVESCKDRHDDPDDAGMLNMCLDNARREYESRIDECENQGQGDCQ